MFTFNKMHSMQLIRTSRESEITSAIMTTNNARCVVTEKIHGANLTARYDGKHYETARRRDVLAPDESFYGVNHITGHLEVAIKAMYDDIKKATGIQEEAALAIEADGGEAAHPSVSPNFKQLEIRGEFAGGNYPAEGVAKVKHGHGQVGKGTIWYNQDKTFFCFGIDVDGVPLDFYEVMTLCQAYAIPTVPILFFGTFSECLEYSKEHLEEPTTVPHMMPQLDENNEVLVVDGLWNHLPEIPDNIREGHVISPVYPMYRDDGRRIAYKHKGTKFLEESGKPKAKGPQKSKEELRGFNENQQAVYDTILPMLNWNRFVSVQSKESEFTPKEFNKAVGLVVQDAIEEAVEQNCAASMCDFVVAYEVLNTKEKKKVTGALMQECAAVLRTQFFS